MLYYSLMIIIIKFMIQLKVILIFVVEETYTDVMNTFYEYTVGVKYFTTPFSREFVSYIIIDALNVFAIVVNRNFLLADGLWTKREDEVENIYEASARLAIYST